MVGEIPSSRQVLSGRGILFQAPDVLLACCSSFLFCWFCLVLFVFRFGGCKEERVSFVQAHTQWVRSSLGGGVDLWFGDLNRSLVLVGGTWETASPNHQITKPPIRGKLNNIP